MGIKMCKFGIWIVFVVIFVLTLRVEAEQSSEYDYDYDVATGSGVIATTSTARTTTRRPKVTPRARTTKNTKVKLYKLLLPNTSPTGVKPGRKKLSRPNQSLSQVRSVKNSFLSGNQNSRSLPVATPPKPVLSPQEKEPLRVFLTREEVDNRTVRLREALSKTILNYTDVGIEARLKTLTAATEILRGLANGTITVHDFLNNAPQLITGDGQQALVDAFKLVRKDAVKYIVEFNHEITALLDTLETVNADSVVNSFAPELKDSPSFLRSAWIGVNRGLENAWNLYRWGIPYRKFRFRK